MCFVRGPYDNEYVLSRLFYTAFHLLRRTEKIVQVNKFVSLVIEHPIGIGVEFCLEQPVAHLTRNVPDVVVVIAESNMHRHVKAIGDGLGIIEARLVLEVEVVIGRGIVVKVVAQQEDLLDARVSVS